MNSIRGAKNLLALLCAVGIPVALAQPGPGGMRMPRYDTSTETTITGTVQEVIAMNSGRMAGTHLMVKTESGAIEVHLGPNQFLSQAGFQFAKGDAVSIVGSKVTIRGVSALLAREVTKDKKTLTLRDKTGRPMWAGRRQAPSKMSFVLRGGEARRCLAL